MPQFLHWFIDVKLAFAVVPTKQFWPEVKILVKFLRLNRGTMIFLRKTINKDKPSNRYMTKKLVDTIATDKPLVMTLLNYKLRWNWLLKWGYCW